MAHPAIRFLLLFTVLLGLAAGCGSPGLPKPTGSSVVTLDEGSRRGSLATKLNLDLKIELPPPKVAGQVWKIIQNDTRYLMPLSDVSEPAADTARSSVRFQTVRVGRTSLRFAAVPPNSTDVAPGDIYEVIVTITLEDPPKPAPKKG